MLQVIRAVGSWLVLMCLLSLQESHMPSDPSCGFVSIGVFVVPPGITPMLQVIRAVGSWLVLVCLLSLQESVG